MDGDYRLEAGYRIYSEKDLFVGVSTYCFEHPQEGRSFRMTKTACEPTSGV